MKLEDHGDDLTNLDDEMERIFNEVFLVNFKESPPVVRLESEDLYKPSCIIYWADCCPVELHKHGQRCTDLIKTTADALSGSVVALMLLTVQKHNLELNVNQAVKWYVTLVRMSRRN